MQDSKPARFSSPRLAHYRRALERIDAHLDRSNSNSEDEEEKIEKALVIMFGEEPSGFVSDPQFDPQHPDAPREDEAGLFPV